MQKFVAHKIY